MMATTKVTVKMPRIVENHENRIKNCLEIPKEIWKLSFPDVESKYHENIRKILAFLADMGSGKLGCIDAVGRRVDLKSDSRPYHSDPYRAGPIVRELEELEIQKQINIDVIETATFVWASLVIFVLKKDGSFRFCIDYCHLNEVTLRDASPLPRIEECIEILGAAKIFSTLDASSGYWQIPAKEEDRVKTAFVCHAGSN